MCHVILQRFGVGTWHKLARYIHCIHTMVSHALWFHELKGACIHMAKSMTLITLCLSIVIKQHTFQYWIYIQQKLWKKKYSYICRVFGMEKDLDSDHKFNLSMVLQQQPLKVKKKKTKLILKNVPFGLQYSHQRYFNLTLVTVI